MSVNARLAFTPGEKIDQVESISLDDLIREYFPHHKSFVVKLDIEGAEMKAFEGARELIEKDSIFIYEDFGGDRSSEITSYLLDQGFQVLFPRADGKLEAISQLDEVKNIKRDKRSAYNFVALKSQGPLSQRILSLCNDSTQSTGITEGNGKIDVLAVCPQLHVGGTELHLLQVLPMLDRNRFSVRLFTTQNGGNLEPKFKAVGISVVSPTITLPSPFHTLLAFVSLVRVLMRDRPEIVHFFLPEAYIVGSLAALIAGRRCLVMSRRSLNNYQARHRIGAWLERKLHKRMKAVLGNSQAVVAQLRREGASSEKVALIYNGIDLKPYEKISSREAARHSLGLAPEAFVLTMVANLFSYKGHADLLKALERVRDELPENWVLLCAGRDVGTGAMLRQLAEELDLAGHIRWLGESDDVPLIFAATDVSLQCSHEEGFANSILEAMASGIPVIATQVGSNPEAVIDGSTGLLVPPRDLDALGAAILKLARDPSLRQAMGVRGRNIVEQRFSLEPCVMQYTRIYEALAAEE